MTAAAEDPLDTFAFDRSRARECGDPCAGLCWLATVDELGQPQVRTVVLRELEGRLAVFGNETSPKWQQLRQGPSVAATVYLPSLEVQYRLQCVTRPVPKPLLHQSWQLRPEMPKRLDWYYTRVQPQSSTVASREALRAQLDGLRLRQPLVAPRTAAGVYLEPTFVERLDLRAPDGLHDRRGFRRHAGGWVAITLVP